MNCGAKGGRGEWSGARAQGAAISESPTHPPLPGSHTTGEAREHRASPRKIWRFAQVRAGDLEIAALASAPLDSNRLLLAPLLDYIHARGSGAVEWVRGLLALHGLRG